MSVDKTTFPEFLGGFVRRYNRQRFIESLLSYLIKMIAVKVRQQHKIQWRQFVDLYRWIGQARGVKSVADRDLFMHVDEGWIG